MDSESAVRLGVDVSTILTGRLSNEHGTKDDDGQKDTYAGLVVCTMFRVDEG